MVEGLKRGDIKRVDTSSEKETPEQKIERQGKMVERLSRWRLKQINPDARVGVYQNNLKENEADKAVIFDLDSLEGYDLEKPLGYSVSVKRLDKDECLERNLDNDEYYAYKIMDVTVGDSGYEIRYTIGFPTKVGSKDQFPKENNKLYAKKEYSQDEDGEWYERN